MTPFNIFPSNLVFSFFSVKKNTIKAASNTAKKPNLPTLISIIFKYKESLNESPINYEMDSSDEAIKLALKKKNKIQQQQTTPIKIAFFLA